MEVGKDLWSALDRSWKRPCTTLLAREKGVWGLNASEATDFSSFSASYMTFSGSA